MVNIIKNNDLETAKKAGVAVVDFSATWCGPCRMLAPVMEQLSEKYAGKAEFFNADVDENTDLAVRYNISNIPAVLIFKNGEVADRSVGFLPAPAMQGFIDKNL